MRFQSTRDAQHVDGLSEAISRGLAPDGGLYVPQQIPSIGRDAFAGADSLAEIARRLIEPFAAGDALAAPLPQITRDAFNFPAPVVDVATPPDDGGNDDPAEEQPVRTSARAKQDAADHRMTTPEDLSGPHPDPPPAAPRVSCSATAPCLPEGEAERHIGSGRVRLPMSGLRRR